MSQEKPGPNNPQEDLKRLLNELSVETMEDIKSFLRKKLKIEGNFTYTENVNIAEFLFIVNVWMSKNPGQNIWEHGKEIKDLISKERNHPFAKLENEDFGTLLVMCSDWCKNAEARLK